MNTHVLEHQKLVFAMEEKQSPVEGKESIRHCCFRVRWSVRASGEVTEALSEVRGRP